MSIECRMKERMAGEPFGIHTIFEERSQHTINSQYILADQRMPWPIRIEWHKMRRKICRRFSYFFKSQRTVLNIARADRNCIYLDSMLHEKVCRAVTHFLWIIHFIALNGDASRHDDKTKQIYDCGFLCVIGLTIQIIQTIQLASSVYICYAW